MTHSNRGLGIPAAHELSDLAIRPADEVFHDHLRLRQSGEAEADIARNYSTAVVLLCGRGRFLGHHGVRESARLLDHKMPGATFRYTTTRVEQIQDDLGIAFLEWQAETDSACIRDGADSFVIQRGRILVQTVHYSVEPRTTTAWGASAKGPTGPALALTTLKAAFPMLWVGAVTATLIRTLVGRASRGSAAG